MDGNSRPQLTRENWTNLNGHWDYEITSADVHQVPDKWTGRILVPFCLESKLGGVQRMLDVGEALWYHRTFTTTPKVDHRTLLNFEAVDYRCAVFVNGQKVGEHQGGNNPFSVDATAALKNGSNELAVRVEDETEGFQLRGKQVLNPHGIWYIQVSGIWQTVWLEEVASQFIEDLDLATDADKGTITVRSALGGKGSAETLRVIVKDGDRTVAESIGDAAEVLVTVPDAKLWSPASPHLYNLVVLLLSADGKVVDEVQSYAGIRTVGKIRDGAGHLRMTLNGRPIFHLGPLDQGWWPDGLLTPGYGDLPKTLAELKHRYQISCERLADLKSKGIAAGVYTQTTDVETEINGLMTYDRRVINLPAEELQKFHAIVLDKQ